MTSSPVISGNKEVTDGKQILGKFCVVVGSFFRTRNHDFRPVVFAEQLEEFKSVPTEPISVGDDNLSDNLSEDAVQKGLKTLPPEVEPRTDVFVDDMAGVLFLEAVYLPIEVFFLFGTGDSCVDDFFLLFRCFVDSSPEVRLDVSDMVDSLSSVESLTLMIALSAHLTRVDLEISNLF